VALEASTPIASGAIGVSDLLDPKLRQRLSGMRLRSPRKGPETALQGPHRGRRRGRSMEFAEHRDYVPGDDLRHLDWNAFARHEKLVIKEFESELERTVLVAVDLSASMNGLKQQRSLELAAAFCWLALLGSDRVALATLGSETRYHPPVRGRGQWGRLMRWLESAPRGGRAGLQDGLNLLAQRLPRSSLLVAISDWLEPQATSLAFVQYRKHQLAALQLLDETDRQPPWFGPLLLEDVETGESRQLSLDDAVCRLYQELLQQHSGALAAECRLRGFAYQECHAESSAETLLLQQLVRAGWLS
jgi:uncharacterized protein (DUF58 family)